MEDEIDLRPWLLAVLRRWRLVAGLSVLLALLATSVAFMQPRSSEASAEVLIVPTSAQITLDQRFVSRDATMLTNTTFQRQTLIGLATSSELARRVITESKGIAAPTPTQLEALLGRIRVSTQGDILRITASGNNEAEALELAEDWGRSYERLIIETFSRDDLLTTLVSEQIDTAQQRYETEQVALEAFYAQGRNLEIERQIRSLQGLIDGSLEAERTLYQIYTRRTQELELILQDAATLREQLLTNTSDELASALTMLALRARANGVSELPLQLSLATASELGTVPVTLSDLDDLIVVLREQRDRLAQEATRIAAAIGSGETGLTGLDSTAVNQYQAQLAELKRASEQLRAEERQLIQRRDTAVASVDLLQRKFEEQRIAELTPQISVRMFSSSVERPSSVLTQLVLYGTAGLLIGIIIGSIVALALEFASMRQPRPTVSTAPAPPNTEGAAKRP